MLSENFKIVPVAAPIDLNAASPVAVDSINMSAYHKCTYVFLFGTLAGADSVLTVCSGATNGAVTSAMYFKYAWATAAQTAAGADVLAAWTNVNTLTIAHATKDNFMLVVEVDAAEMDMVNGEKWLTAIFTDPGGATGLVNGVAILEPRYGNNASVTAIA